MKKFLMSTALGAMLIAGGVAIAQPGPGDGPQMRHGLPGDTNGDGTLTKAELTASLDKKFAEMDLNHDGKVTPDERVALRQKRLDERFAKLDTDGNGQLSKAEFAAAHEGPGRGPQDGHKADGPDGPSRPTMGHRGMMGGKGRDADRDGTLTREEFMAGPLAMFDRADTNKDGKVTTEEAKAGWKAFGEGRGKRDHGPNHGPDHGGADMPPPPPAQ